MTAAEIDALLARLDIWSDQVAYAKEAAAAIRELRAALAQDAAAGELVAWVRTLHGEIDWSEDCLSMHEEDVPNNEGYGMIPLYARPTPAAVPPASEQMVLVPRADLEQAAMKLETIGRIYDGDKQSRRLAAEFGKLLAAAKEPQK